MQLIMSKLSEKIYSDIKSGYEELPDNGLNGSYINDLIKKLVDISIKLEASQTDIESSSIEFQNYMYEKLP